MSPNTTCYCMLKPSFTPPTSIRNWSGHVPASNAGPTTCRDVPWYTINFYIQHNTSIYFRENNILVYTRIWSDKSWCHDLKWEIPFQVVISCSMVYQPTYTWYISAHKYGHSYPGPDAVIGLLKSSNNSVSSTSLCSTLTSSCSELGNNLRMSSIAFRMRVDRLSWPQTSRRPVVLSKAQHSNSFSLPFLWHPDWSIPLFSIHKGSLVDRKQNILTSFQFFLSECRNKEPIEEPKKSCSQKMVTNSMHLQKKVALTGWLTFQSSYDTSIIWLSNWRAAGWYIIQDEDVRVFLFQPLSKLCIKPSPPAIH